MPPEPKRKTRTSPDTARLKRIGAKIRNARKALDWSLENLADEANTSKSQIHYAENGRNVTVNTLANIAFALGLPTSYFFDS